MRLVAVACAAAGSRTFALDSRASAPYLQHDTRGDPVGQYVGGGGVLPRTPPRRVAASGGRSGRPDL